MPWQRYALSQCFYLLLSAWDYLLWWFPVVYFPLVHYHFWLSNRKGIHCSLSRKVLLQKRLRKKLWGSLDWFTCKMPIKMHVVMVRYSSVVALLLDVKIWERSLGMILLECNTRPCYGDVLIFCVCVSTAEVETCCSVLRKLLDAVDATALLSNFHTELLLGLDSHLETVRHLCLVQVTALLTCWCCLQCWRVDFTFCTNVTVYKHTLWCRFYIYIHCLQTAGIIGVASLPSEFSCWIIRGCSVFKHNMYTISSS